MEIRLVDGSPAFSKQEGRPTTTDVIVLSCAPARPTQCDVDPFTGQADIAVDKDGSDLEVKMSGKQSAKCWE